jgi:hypothetical protein
MEYKGCGVRWPRTAFSATSAEPGETFKAAGFAAR